MKICIKNGILLSMDSKKDKLEYNTDILIDDNKIVEIGKDLKVDKGTKVIDASNKIVMPGLINTHGHVPMSIFRETIDGYDLQSWLTEKIWPLEDKLTADDVYYTSYLSYLEMIMSGSTTINDMYFFTDSIIKAAEDSGVRLQTTRTLMGSGNDEYSIKRIEELKELLSKKYSDRISLNVGIHGLYTIDSDYLKKCLEIQEETGLNIHMHFVENLKEVEDIKNNFNMNPVDVLEKYFKDKKTILAHCVCLNEDEINRLSKLNVSVSHCPVSNLKLGCGIANINEMLDKGINVSLGTDGQGSACNLDLFESMKYAALLQKGVLRNPKVMNAYEVIKMATINGAKALGLDDKIGSIEVGKLADIIIIDLDDIKLKPKNDLISQIVYNVNSSNVDTTIIDGKILLENHKLTNDKLDKISSKCDSIIDRITK